MMTVSEVQEALELFRKASPERRREVLRILTEAAAAHQAKQAKL